MDPLGGSGVKGGKGVGQVRIARRQGFRVLRLVNFRISDSGCRV